MPPPAPDPTITASYFLGCFLIWRSPILVVGLCDWWKKSKFKGLAKQKTNKYLFNRLFKGRAVSGAEFDGRLFSLRGRLVTDSLEFGTRLPLRPVMAKGQFFAD